MAKVKDANAGPRPVQSAKRIASVEALEKLREEARARKVGLSTGDHCEIRLCAGAGCIASGSLDFKAAWGR